MSFLIRDIEKSFGKKRVLSSLSLELYPGECVGIVGENGCGKSTLLNILAGLLRPDGGKFLWEEQDLLSHAALLRRTVGYVPQQPPLIPELNALDHLRLWYERERLEKELKGGILFALGIGEFLKTPVAKMSGGMKKRLAIACALAATPRLLLMDEPSAALDLKAKEQLIGDIRAFVAAGQTVLLVTHDPTELSMCDRLFLMKDGGLRPYAYDGDSARLARSL